MVVSFNISFMNAFKIGKYPKIQCMQGKGPANTLWIIISTT